MKTLDQFSKRFLSITMGISMVVLSLSLFMITVSPANADTDANKEIQVEKMLVPDDPDGVGIYPFGIHDGKMYWLEWTSSSGWQFNSKAIADWK